MRTMMLAALAVFALPCVAMAADAASATAGFPVRSSFDAPGVQEWPASLERGRLYALEEDGDVLADVSVIAAGGGTIASFGGDGLGAVGTSFRAPYTGSYTVRVQATRLIDGASYTLRLERDCPDDASSPCRIAPGQTHAGQRTTYDGDHDWFRVTDARPGRRYVVTLASENGDAVAVRNGAGKVIAGPVDAGAAWEPRALVFTVPENGKAYLDVATVETTPTSYSLELAPAH